MYVPRTMTKLPAAVKIFRDKLINWYAGKSHFKLPPTSHHAQIGDNKIVMKTYLLNSLLISLKLITKPDQLFIWNFKWIDCQLNTVQINFIFHLLHGSLSRCSWKNSLIDIAGSSILCTTSKWNRSLPFYILPRKCQWIVNHETKWLTVCLMTGTFRLWHRS